MYRNERVCVWAARQKADYLWVITLLYARMFVAQKRPPPKRHAQFRLWRKINVKWTQMALHVHWRRSNNKHKHSNALRQRSLALSRAHFRALCRNRAQSTHFYRLFHNIIDCRCVAIWQPGNISKLIVRLSLLVSLRTECGENYSNLLKRKEGCGFLVSHQQNETKNL